MVFAVLLAISSALFWWSLPNGDLLELLRLAIFNGDAVARAQQSHPNFWIPLGLAALISLLAGMSDRTHSTIAKSTANSDAMFMSGFVMYLLAAPIFAASYAVYGYGSFGYGLIFGIVIGLVGGFVPTFLIYLISFVTVSIAEPNPLSRSAPTGAAITKLRAAAESAANLFIVLWLVFMASKFGIFFAIDLATPPTVDEQIAQLWDFVTQTAVQNTQSAEQQTQAVTERARMTEAFGTQLAFQAATALRFAGQQTELAVIQQTLGAPVPTAAPTLTLIPTNIPQPQTTLAAVPVSGENPLQTQIAQLYATVAVQNGAGGGSSQASTPGSPDWGAIGAIATIIFGIIATLLTILQLNRRN